MSPLRDEKAVPQMQIHDSYLLYTPPVVPPSPGPARALTPGAWQAEMSQWLALHDTEQAAFTPLAGAAVADTAEADASAVVGSRDGRLLRRGTLLKADHYPGLHKMNLNTGKTPQPRITGAPNYRKVDGENIHGVAQPTVQGIQGVLAQVGAGPGQSGPAAVWTNLREEPVVYVNGRPLNVRVQDEWTRNVENPGASSQKVEDADAKLKQDVLAEAQRNGGRVLVHDETPDGRLVARWETLESVETPREVFDELKQQGYRVDYARIPISDEKAPEETDFDVLVERMRSTRPDQPVIFNCHAGRGRTTTGMVMTGLLRRAAEVEADERITRSQPVREDIKEQADYKRGEYKVILSLIRTLERGPRNKEEADAIIDQYSGLQNLRESIVDYKEKSESAPTAQARQEARERGQQYLHRYFYLIAFDAYAKEQSPAGFTQRFSEWMKERPELHRMLDNVQLAMGFTHREQGPAYA